MKKTYFDPQLKFIQISSADIIATSGDMIVTGDIDPAGSDEIWDLT